MDVVLFQLSLAMVIALAILLALRLFTLRPPVSHRLRHIKGWWKNRAPNASRANQVASLTRFLFKQGRKQ